MKATLLNALRKGTQVLIGIDSHPIVLIPHERVKKPGGVYDWEEQNPRDPQNLILEPVGATLAGIAGTSGGVTNTEGASVHQWDYELVGPWDAKIEIGDTWVEGETSYRVTSIRPYNGYEKRATVSAIGKDPSYGN